MPEKTDMTPEQYAEIMATPIEQVAEYTKNEELKDYAEDLATLGLSGTIDMINGELYTAQESKKAAPKKPRKKKIE